MLRPLDQRIVRLCLIDSLSYEQVAAQLGIIHGSVRNRLSRSKKQLHLWPGRTESITPSLKSELLPIDRELDRIKSSLFAQSMKQSVRLYRTSSRKGQNGRSRVVAASPG